MIQVFAVNSGFPDQAVSLKSLAFPGGEMHVTVAVDVPGEVYQIKAHLPNAASVMELLMTTDALRRAYPGAPIQLYMPYVPYARQDRVANPGEALSIRVFANLINAQGYQEVLIEDPHSDVTPALINNVRLVDIAAVVGGIVSRLSGMTGAEVALVAPDAGARKRVLSIAKQLGGLDVVYAEKVRDTKTGRILRTEVPANLPSGPLLVVDDICDGGATFIELAKALKERYRETNRTAFLNLYVTHGIFSKGIAPLAAHFQNIYTRKDWSASGNCLLV